MTPVRPVLLSVNETVFLLGILHALLSRPEMPSAGDRFAREVIAGVVEKLVELANAFEKDMKP